MFVIDWSQIVEGLQIGCLVDLQQRAESRSVTSLAPPPFFSSSIFCSDENNSSQEKGTKFKSYTSIRVQTVPTGPAWAPLGGEQVGGGAPALMCTALYSGQSENGKYPSAIRADESCCRFWRSWRWAGLLVVLCSVTTGAGEGETRAPQ